MKKLLLATAAAGALLAAAPAHAAVDGVNLELGGYFKGYVGYLDQDEVTGGDEVQDIGWLQDSEIHFTGEATLDNGLIVGAHFELEADGGDTEIQESYVYFQGDWGRVNAGNEDGAAFLLQVAAPSADSNYDGVRQYISPFNYDAGVVPSSVDDDERVPGALEARFADNPNLDYAQDPTGYAQKLTYLSPVFSGFQAGVSFTPDADSDSPNPSFGFGTDESGNYEEAYEGAVRWEGQYDQVGIILGGGYSLLTEADDATDVTDDREVWNVGLDVNFQAFGLGAVYKSDNQGQKNDGDRDTLVVGADYTTGPFKLGASWLNEETELTANSDLEIDRYTGGVVYEYGPGMTFRGSLSYIEHQATGEEDIDGFTVLLGTQVNF